MESTVKESIKLLLISFIISLLVSMFSDFDLRIGFFVYVFVYFLSFLLVPYWLRNNNINWGIKLFLTIFVGIISITAIAYIYGIGRTLHTYTVAFCVLIISLIVINCIKKKIKR
ncbi:hypothetical protein D2962_06465 [Biomaibacter acetigenes]|jgi:hypothetical protein|uniref:Uncharacterized protein n=1 Tax=Biomaibacter acetigenes TaxID=2316383 RepID=A0A3G2R4K5_9FIRM|nr:hypothetical protein D2962_06465 [Biomaibacter acetigenes]RKL62735.1 hypothetical protein DXT63_09780 [Thermoanaerobacteraceae bacterium SP2]